MVILSRGHYSLIPKAVAHDYRESRLVFGRDSPMTSMGYYQQITLGTFLLHTWNSVGYTLRSNHKSKVRRGLFIIPFSFLTGRRKKIVWWEGNDAIPLRCNNSGIFKFPRKLMNQTAKLLCLYEKRKIFLSMTFGKTVTWKFSPSLLPNWNVKID